MSAGKLCLPGLMIAGALAAPVASAIPSDKPNIIFILADDMGWGDLGCFGNIDIKTPHLDQMAKEGTRYTQFYANAVVCSPSRAAFMTGQFPARLGAHTIYATHAVNQQRQIPDYLDPAVPNVTQLLNDAGYATGHFGKWHLSGRAESGIPIPSMSEYGMDRHFAICSTGPSLMDSPGFKEAIKEESGFGHDWAYSSEGVVNETIRFIEDNPNKPFYVNAWMLVPHAILNPTEEQREPYRKYSPGVVSHDGKYKPWEVHGAMEHYYGAITGMDKQIGRLLDYLDEKGLSENTLVLFASDNGPESIYTPNASLSGVGMPGPFRGLKRSLYEGGVRMPCIVRWVGKIQPNVVNNTSVLSGVDWLPTVCSLANIALPDGMKSDGEDVSDILLGDSRVRTRPLYWEWLYRVIGRDIDRSPSLAIRDGDWKLVMDPDGSRLALYNVVSDPSETDSLADQNPDVVAVLKKKLSGWKAEISSPDLPSWATAPYPWPEPME